MSASCRFTYPSDRQLAGAASCRHPPKGGWLRQLASCRADGQLADGPSARENSDERTGISRRGQLEDLANDRRWRLLAMAAFLIREAAA